MNVQVLRNYENLACGTFTIRYYREDRPTPAWVSIGPKMFKGEGNKGIGMVIGSFIKDNTDSDKVFAEMCEYFDLTFLSPCRKNKNSGHKNYIAIWDITPKAKDIV